MFVSCSKAFSALMAFAFVLSVGFSNSVWAESSNDSIKLASNTSARGALKGFPSTLKNTSFAESELEMLPDLIKSYNDYQPRIDREQPRLLRKSRDNKVAVQ